MINDVQVKILKALKQGEIKGFVTLWRIVGGGISTVKTELDDLIERGLVKDNRQSTWPFRRDFSLTERGIKFLEKYEELEAM
jgi:predicted transcriptional regulator